MRAAVALLRATVAWLLVAALAAPAPARAGLRECAKLVVADPMADPGTGAPGGAIFDVDPDQPPDANSSLAGGGPESVFLADCAVAGGDVFLADLEADPSLLGPDANGNPGHGAIFRMDGLTGALSLVADGTNCGGSIASCGAGGVFVDPVSIAADLASGMLLVADPDADPSGLGVDALGHAGHGALLRVDPVTGLVELVADGSNYPAGIPGGAPSVFEDPVAVAVGRDGAIYVADQLARPDARVSAAGAVFRVDPATGIVTLVAANDRFRGLRDVAVEPDGLLLVLDRLAGGKGTLFRVSPAGPPDGNIVAFLASSAWVEPAGVVADGMGRIHVLDTAADPLVGAPDGYSGAVFDVDAALTLATPLSSTPDYRAPWGLALLADEGLSSAVPPAADAGTTLQVLLTGGTFFATPSVSFGPDVEVLGVTWLNAGALAVDIRIPAAAPAGLVNVTVTNPDPVRTHAFHCELFELRAVPPCPRPPEVRGLRVAREGDALRLAWDATGDACVTEHVVHRAESARPATLPGRWPDDPAFPIVSAGDSDPSDTRLEIPAARGMNEYFLVTAVNRDGATGPAGAYGDR